MTVEKITIRWMRYPLFVQPATGYYLIVITRVDSYLIPCTQCQMCTSIQDCSIGQANSERKELVLTIDMNKPELLELIQ